MTDNPKRLKEILPIAGVRVGAVAAGIRARGRLDLGAMCFCEGTQAVAAFTTNRFAAAPVRVAREHLDSALPRAFLVNSGCANAATGKEGERRAKQTCEALAQVLGTAKESILPFSTGVILEPLPVAPIVEAIPGLVSCLDAGEKGWLDFASAIMTTDTRRKIFSWQAALSTGVVTLTGVAKGAGMIHPDMATMLAFVATDAQVSPEALNAAFISALDRSFHAISIDGDTSTNDSFVLAATQKGPALATFEDEALFLEAVVGLAQDLALAIVADGEGATKQVCIRVTGAESVMQAKKVAQKIALSPLVKTAFYASDPNLGRILAAAGAAGEEIFPERISLWLEDLLVFEKGERARFEEEHARGIMQEPSYTIRLDLGQGEEETDFWTCDFTEGYIRINAAYRS